MERHVLYLYEITRAGFIMKKFLTASLCALLLSSAVCQAADEAAVFDENQEKAIKQIIHDYVSTHPEIIVAAMQQLEREQINAQIENVKKFSKELRSDKLVPSLGTADARYYIIEFFDFNCGYCKFMEPFMDKIRAELKDDIQIMYVNYPLIAKTSIKAATVAQAVQNYAPDKYFSVHNVMMSEKINYDDLDEVRKVIERLGLNWDDVLGEIKTNRPQDKLAENVRMGKTLSVQGTPYFIINGTEYRGAIQSYDEFKDIVTKDTVAAM